MTGVQTCALPISVASQILQTSRNVLLRFVCSSLFFTRLSFFFPLTAVAYRGRNSRRLSSRENKYLIQDWILVGRWITITINNNLILGRRYIWRLCTRHYMMVTLEHTWIKRGLRINSCREKESKRERERWCMFFKLTTDVDRWNSAAGVAENTTFLPASRVLRNWCSIDWSIDRSLVALDRHAALITLYGDRK